jgi:hypothetical protein
LVIQLLIIDDGRYSTPAKESEKENINIPRLQQLYLPSSAFFAFFVSRLSWNSTKILT